MNKRLASSVLMTLLGLVVLGVFALFSGEPARAGAPPVLSGAPNGPATQQKNAPAQPFGGGSWDLLATMPYVDVELPDEERGIPKPASIKRAGAAFYHPNGKIYLLGGRMGLDGTDNVISYNKEPNTPPYTWIFEYTPGDPGSWLRKQADLDVCTHQSGKCPGERYTSNMAVATLTDTTGVAIYAIGGTSVNSVPTNRVRRYDPVADAVTYLTSDPWPASPARIPGGYAVLNNKLYIFGGFNPLGNGTMYADTWVFDPMAATGSKWQQILTANLSTARAYIASAVLDGYIYAVGGDTWQTNVDVTQRKLVPSNAVERMDPTTGIWQPVASLPEGRGDAGAWAFDTGTGYGISGKLVVGGGHRNPPDSPDYLVPDNLAYVLSPPSVVDPDGSWSSFIGLTYATRNFGYVAAGGSFYAIGGYDYSSGSPYSAGYSQRFDGMGNVPTTTATPTPSNTATATNTATGTLPTNTPTGTATRIPPTATAATTACTVRFQDVAAGSTFYPFVRCLACRGVLSGYPCGGPGEPCNGSGDPYFRPGNNITRGQIAKVVSQSAQLFDAPLDQIYEDVSPDTPFYQWINRLTRRGYMSGYACGTTPAEPCGEGNRPYFRPNAPATRGQLSKIVANTAEIHDAVAGQTYADVPVSNDPSSLYVYIERLTQRGVMGGYTCGTSDPNSGPCDGQNRAYFRPGNLVTRGQAAKIVSNTFFPECQTP